MELSIRYKGRISNLERMQDLRRDLTRLADESNSI